MASKPEELKFESCKIILISFQETFIKVLLRFIGDSDVRLRKTAAKTFAETVVNLYFPIDNTDEVLLY